MPADVAFDTRAEFKRFVDAGADERLADAIVDHSKETLRGIATKEDLRTLETALEAKIDTSVGALNAKIDHSVALLGTDLKWIKIIGGTIVGLLVLPWLVQLVGATLPGS